MREAKVADGWRRVLKTDEYPNKVSKVSIKNFKGFFPEIEVTFSSGLSAICGKNGVGKSTFLRSVYEKIKFNEVNTPKSVGATVLIESGDTGNQELSESVFYLDPSYECSKIITFLSQTSNFDELLEGVEVNRTLSNIENLATVSKAIGKQYTAILIYEIENCISEDTTLPYFEVTLADGTTYKSESMGMGEHLCMYLFWFANWIEKNSILLIEEVENYLSAYSQKTLIDYLAYKLNERKVWTIISTHSEHILDKVGLENVAILHSRNGNSKFVNANRVRDYLKALGLSDKITGAFLVEDRCAELFLKYLINQLDQSLLDNKEIIGLRCDSNLEKVCKHFQPSKVLNYDFLVVFDGDQSDKVNSLNDKYIPITALPSIRSLSPEEELWATVFEEQEELANRLSSQLDRLSEAFEDNATTNHHDRFHNIAQELNIDYESLIARCVNVWLSKERNLPLALGLILVLRFRNSPISQKEAMDYLKTINIPQYTTLPEQLLAGINNAKNQFSIKFDGLESSLI